MSVPGKDEYYALMKILDPWMWEMITSGYEPTEADKLALDMWLYGEAYMDENGNRIDPTTVIVDETPLCPMAPYEEDMLGE